MLRCNILVLIKNHKRNRISSVAMSQSLTMASAITWSPDLKQFLEHTMRRILIPFGRRQLIALMFALNSTLLTVAATLAILGASATAPQTGQPAVFASANPFMWLEA